MTTTHFRGKKLRALAAGIVCGAAWIQGLRADDFAPALGWDGDAQSHFPTSITARGGAEIFVGTEDKGLWRYLADEKKWTQITTKDGLGDGNIYALAVDKLGRVWAGHLNHGVSVFNGEKWRNYTALDGPLGDRIFSIATCPTDGDVWMATECGVARYSMKRDDWDYYTRASGLPSNQIQAVAFDKEGNIFLGTQCDGVAMANAADDYKKWRIVSGPRRMSNSAGGEGLPSNSINAMLAIGDRIIAATPCGLGAIQRGLGGKPDGKTWLFARGADWEENVRGLYPAQEPRLTPDGLQIMVTEKLPSEDWINCLAERDGKLWLGYRQKGFEFREISKFDSLALYRSAEPPPNFEHDFVRAVLLAPNFPPLIALYDNKTGGLKTVGAAPKTAEIKSSFAVAPFPAAAKPPDKSTCAFLQKMIEALKPMQPGEAAYLGDDWQTGGDWVGGYGTSYAALCGVTGTGDHEFVSDPRIKVRFEVGPHVKDTAVYTYIQHAKSENPRVLYDPQLGCRCEAERNDGSFDVKNYPLSWEGPDLWVSLNVPEGTHSVALYFHNNDEQLGTNQKYRDYDVALVGGAADSKKKNEREVLARTRVTDFWGGVYKQFLVCGPGDFFIKIGRNRSACTKLQGVFIDQITGNRPDPPDNFPGLGEVRFEPPEVDENAPANNSEVVTSARALWSALDDALGTKGNAGLQYPFRICALRAAIGGGAGPDLIARWRFQMALWTPEERERFKETMQRGFEASHVNPPVEDGGDQ